VHVERQFQVDVILRPEVDDFHLQVDESLLADDQVDVQEHGGHEGR
jgi:hypothetical protein